MSQLLEWTWITSCLTNSSLFYPHVLLFLRSQSLCSEYELTWWQQPKQARVYDGHDEPPTRPTINPPPICKLQSITTNLAGTPQRKCNNLLRSESNTIQNPHLFCFAALLEPDQTSNSTGSTSIRHLVLCACFHPFVSPIL